MCVYHVFGVYFHVQSLAYFCFLFFSFGLESSIQLKEEKITLDNVHEAMFASHQRDKNKLTVAKERVVKAIPGVEVTASIKYEHGRDSAIDVNALSEAQQRPESNNKQLKRKDKSLASKVSIATTILNKKFQCSSTPLSLSLSFTLLFLADVMNLSQFMG